MISALTSLVRLGRAGFIFAREGVFGVVDPVAIPPSLRPLIRMVRVIERPSSGAAEMRLSSALTRLEEPEILAIGQRREPVSEERRGAAKMRELPADPRITLEHAAVDQVGDRPRGLERKLVEPDRMLCERLSVRWERRVNEHVGSATIELGHQRLERLIAEVGAGDVRRQQHPVDVSDHCAAGLPPSPSRGG